MLIVDMLEEPLEVTKTLQVHKIVREITKENIPFINFFKLSRDDTPAYTLSSTIDRRKILKSAVTIEMSMIARVLTVMHTTKSVTKRKSVAHFVKSGFMKVVFMNYN